MYELVMVATAAKSRHICSCSFVNCLASPFSSWVLRRYRVCVTCGVAGALPVLLPYPGKVHVHVLLLVVLPPLPDGPPLLNMAFISVLVYDIRRLASSHISALIFHNCCISLEDNALISTSPQALKLL